MKSQSNNSLNFIEGLDGLRALSALLVFSAHWPSNMLSLKFGWIGVSIFFALSGFLITRILVRDKDLKIGQYLGLFYYKRLIRIFPLYYLFIIFAALLILALTVVYPSLLTDTDWKSADFAVRKDIWYYLTYTYNIKINLRYFFDWTDTSNQFFGHLWSLAVEEQFYLIFPFVVYYCSVDNLKKVVIGILIACPLIRLYAALYGVDMVTDKYWLGELLYSNTLCQADALAAGAALALFPITIKRRYITFFIVLGVWLLVGITCFVFLRKSGYEHIEGKSLGYNFPAFWLLQQTPYPLINLRVVYQYFLTNLLAISLILPFVQGKPLFPSVFCNKAISYLGKISYGFYVFHNFIIACFIVFANQRLGGLSNIINSPAKDLLSFVICLALTILLSHFSFKYFESKFMKFKNKIKFEKINA